MQFDTTSIILPCCAAVLFMCLLHMVVRSDAFVNYLLAGDDDDAIPRRIINGIRRRGREREMRGTMRRLCRITQAMLLLAVLVGVIYLVDHVMILTHISEKAGWRKAVQAAFPGGIRRLRPTKRQDNYTPPSWETDAPSFYIPWTVAAALACVAAVVALGVFYLRNQHQAVMQAHRNEFSRFLIATVVALIVAILAA